MHVKQVGAGKESPLQLARKRVFRRKLLGERAPRTSRRKQRKGGLQVTPGATKVKRWVHLLQAGGCHKADSSHCLELTSPSPCWACTEAPELNQQPENYPGCSLRSWLLFSVPFCLF